MVTWVVPAGPLVGLKAVIDGAGGVTVKELELVPVPVTVVTLIVPEVAAAGTVAVICPSLFTVNVVAEVPLNFTEVAPVKPTPLMTVPAPTVPEVGLNPLTDGGGPTVKEVPLVPVPVAVVTEIAPVVAPEGTAAVIEISLQPLAVAIVVPNFRTLAP
jgi:hypothetical protein